MLSKQYIASLFIVMLAPVIAAGQSAEEALSRLRAMNVAYTPEVFVDHAKQGNTAVVVLSPLTAMAYDNKMAVPLRPGIFLVATPALDDSNFIHTVILLVSYGKDGTVGLVINRPSGVSLQQVLPDLKGIEKKSLPLYFGGPVTPDSLYILFSSDHPVQGTKKVFDSIYFTDQKDVIIPILQDQELNNKVRIYAGLAGWFHGQLEQEVRRGAWVTMEADPKMVFTDNPLSIWPSIFKIRDDLLVQR